MALAYGAPAIVPETELMDPRFAPIGTIDPLTGMELVDREFLQRTPQSSENDLLRSKRQWPVRYSNCGPGCETKCHFSFFLGREVCDCWCPRM